jgi:hypothetical protein
MSRCLGFCECCCDCCCDCCSIPTPCCSCCPQMQLQEPPSECNQPDITTETTVTAPKKEEKIMVRTDFCPLTCYETIITNEKGIGIAKFKLKDNLTRYRF